MANVNIKFNNKDYLLSCDDGQEESLKKLTSFLDKKYNELKDQLGGIGESKLLLITTIKIADDYFNLKQKVDLQKNKLEKISEKFLEMKSLAIQYKEKKDTEINNLNIEIDKLRVAIEERNSLYESVLDKTTKSLQEIISNTESKPELQ
jgi:cell division protein ZapA